MLTSSKNQKSLVQTPVGSWRLISANVYGDSSANVDQIVKMLLSPEFARAHFAFDFALQETRSWYVLNLSLPFCFFFKVTTPRCFRPFCKIQRSWRSEERCTAVLFGSVFVMAVYYAPDSGKDLEEYEKFIKEATIILHERRRAGARHFCIAGDLNIELGLPCTGDEDDQELREIILKDFNCKAASAWSSCDDPTGEDLYTQTMGLGLYLGPKMMSSQTYIHKLCST